MTFATEIAKVNSQPRVVVDLYFGGSGHNYYGFTHSLINGTTSVEGRILSISPIEHIASDKGIQIPQCDIELDNTDNVISDLGIDQDLIVYVKFGYLDLAIGSFQDWTFDLSGPARYEKNKCILRCEAPTRRLLGEINPPVVDSDLISSEPRYSNLSGATLPCYFGYFDDDEYAIELIRLAGIVTGSSESARYLVRVKAQDDPELFNPSNLRLFFFNDDGVKIILPDTDGTSTYWDIDDSTTVSPENFPVSWALEEIVLYEDCIATFGITTNTIIYAVTTGDGDLLDGNALVTNEMVTPASLIDMLGVGYIAFYNTTTSQYEQVDAQGIFQSSIEEARYRMHYDGIGCRYKVSTRKDTLSMFEEIIENTGLKIYSGRNGILYFSYYSNDDSTETTGGYSSEDSFKDYLHCIDIERIDINRVTGGYALLENNSEFIQDNDALDDAEILNKNFSFNSLTKTGARQVVWRKIQEKKDSTNARRFRIDFPLVVVDKMPNDIFKFTEKWTGLSDVPVLFEKIVFDPASLMISAYVQDLSGWTDVDAYCLIDEAAITRTYPVTTATAHTGLTNVELSSNPADTYTIAVGDIFETFSSTNNKCSKIASAPTWNGSDWVIQVTDAIFVNETIAASDWRCTKSWLTASTAEKAESGFLCDTDDEFSNSDDGKVLVM